MFRNVRLVRESMPAAAGAAGCCAATQGTTAARPSARDRIRMLVSPLRISHTRYSERAPALRSKQHAGDRRGQKIGEGARDHRAEPQPGEVVLAVGGERPNLADLDPYRAHGREPPDGSRVAREPPCVVGRL